MKFVRVGMYVNVLVDVDMKKVAPNLPVSKYQHARVTEVTDQDTIKVSVGGGPEMVALRLDDPPVWRVNRFGAGT
jgi:hypothetical protein